MAPKIGDVFVGVGLLLKAVASLAMMIVCLLIAVLAFWFVWDLWW